jgi:predicted nucleic acid-binding protein
VIAYHLVGTEKFRLECGEFWRAVTDAIAPASWEAELANVVWNAARAGVFPAEESLRRLDLATALGIRAVSVASLWHGAVARACSSGIAAYDTLFVELAEREKVPLVTFDAAVLKAFPSIACQPAALLAST